MTNHHHLPPPSEPCILAAGHRRIPAPKSGHTYPAFLVRFPIPTAPREKESKQQPSSTTTTTTCIARWRTKRDFLLLSRAIKHNSSSTNQMNGEEASSCRSFQKSNPSSSKVMSKMMLFPKAAYSKLCDAAETQPWIRPGVIVDGSADDDKNGRYCIESFLPGESKEEENCSYTNNSYQPRMYKPLNTLDSFLLGAMSIAAQEEEKDEVKVAWDTFSRMQDAEHLISFQSEVIRGNRHEDEQAQTLRSTMNSSRKRSLQQSLDQKEEGEEEKTREANNTDVRRAAQLGQYFASDANASMVVTNAIRMAKLCDHSTMNNNRKKNDDDDDDRDIIF
eukprot:514728-Ditylum_brightwellii.AAC.1